MAARIKVSEEQAQRIVMLRDKEGFSFHTIAKIEGISRTGCQYVWHKHHNTEVYQAKLRHSSEKQRQIREEKGPAPKVESQEMRKIYAKDYEGADIRRLWNVLQGTTAIERGLYE